VRTRLRQAGRLANLTRGLIGTMTRTFKVNFTIYEREAGYHVVEFPEGYRSRIRKHPIVKNLRLDVTLYGTAILTT